MYNTCRVYTLHNSMFIIYKSFISKDKKRKMSKAEQREADHSRRERRRDRLNIRLARINVKLGKKKLDRYVNL